MTLRLALKIFAGLGALFIVGQALWIGHRNRERTAEPMEPKQKPWVASVPRNFQTPAVRHLGATRIGIDREKAA